jgi:hypothetical protein
MIHPLRAHALALSALLVLVLLALESRVRPWADRHVDASVAIGGTR